MDGTGNIQSSMAHLECNQKVKAYVRSCFTINTLKKKLPILTWLPKYRYSDFKLFHFFHVSR